jgi:glycosyltransferase involved in cell wall biosynthesis
MLVNRKILYIQYTNPAGYPSLEHSSRILARDGWRVLFLGTGAHGADALRFSPHERIEVRRVSFNPAGWRQKLHYLQFSLWVIFWILRRRPRWVYASDPLSSPIALLLSFLPGLRIIYHEHDSPQLDVSGQRSEVSQFMRFSLWTRRRLAQRVALSILPNETRVTWFKEQTGTRAPVLCVWNCPRTEETRVEPSQKNGSFSVYYHGNISPRLLPETLIKVLELIPEANLCVVGYTTIGSETYPERLRELAKMTRVADRVQIHNAVSRCALLDETRQHSIGWAALAGRIDEPNLLELFGASNKVFDYLACGLPVLVSDLPEWRSHIVDAGYGLACNPEDPRSIAQAVKWFLDHPNEMRTMAERGRQKIAAEWNYETQFAPVIQVLNKKNEIRTT